jgi:hypothetical protein
MRVGTCHFVPSAARRSLAAGPTVHKEGSRCVRTWSHTPRASQSPAVGEGERRAIGGPRLVISERHPVLGTPNHHASLPDHGADIVDLVRQKIGLKGN